jgi:hypothetical protein
MPGLISSATMSNERRTKAHSVALFSSQEVFLLYIAGRIRVAKVVAPKGCTPALDERRLA